MFFPTQRLRENHTVIDITGSPLTLRQLFGSNPTPEEFHYMYDVGGRLLGAGFAMTPQSWTPPSGQPYYNETETPLYRAHAVYDIDAGNRTNNLWYYYEQQSGGSWNQQSVRVSAMDMTR